MKTILITGCSSGYGLATARHFHAQGWNVIATMRTPRADVLPASDRVRVLPLDVTAPNSIAQALQAAGPIDVLVNNAGLGLFGAFEATPMTTVRDIFDTNTFGTMAMTQAVLPQMRERGAGLVVNVTSSATLAPMPLVAAYTASGSGPNLGLQSARSTHAEIGVKTRLAEGHRLDAALFHIGTTDEIVVASSSGGRTIYTNAGKTRRSGLEVAYSGQLSPEWRTHVALSTLNAKFADAFASSSGATVAKGNRIPGTVDRALFAELAWQPRAVPGMTAALELVHQGGMAVDDLNSDRTEAATLFNLRLGFEQKLGAWKLRESLRLDNLADKATIGSVIANDGNRRFFEPAPGRQWGVGATVSYAF